MASSMINIHIAENVTNPAVLVETEHLLVKFAETDQEIEDAMRLRYQIFNVEQGKGLAESSDTGIDTDPFDAYCLHILVIEKASATIVGTYRAHLGSVAAKSPLGFYSAREYDIGGLSEITDKCVELGRSCVAPEFRTGAAMTLLWNAIYALMMRGNLFYMIGCVSLDTKDQAMGWGLYEHFRANDMSCDIISGKARPEFYLDKPSPEDAQNIVLTNGSFKKNIPALLKGYLYLGGKICGEPAYDHEFGTIDYLILVDFRKIPEKYLNHFKQNCK